MRDMAKVPRVTYTLIASTSSRSSPSRGSSRCTARRSTAPSSKKACSSRGRRSPKAHDSTGGSSRAASCTRTSCTSASTCTAVPARDDARAGDRLAQVLRHLLHLAAWPAPSARCSPPPHSLTLGASGAIFGLMGAAVVELRARRISVMESGIGGLIVLNLILSFTLPNISGRRPHRRADRRRGGGARDPLGDRHRAPALGLIACLLIAAAASRVRRRPRSREVEPAGAAWRPRSAPNRERERLGAGGRAPAARPGAGCAPAARGRRSAAGRGARSRPRRSPPRSGVRSERRELLGIRHRLGLRARGVIAAGHHHDHLGLGGRDGLPGDRSGRALPARPSTSSPPASSISSGVQWPADIHRVKPLERRHPRPSRARRTARSTRSMRRSASLTSSRPLLGLAGRLGQRVARRRASPRASSGQARSPAAQLGSALASSATSS